MVCLDSLLARRGGIFRLISLAIEGDPIALTVVGVAVLAIVAFVGIKIFNAANTPDSDFSDEDMTAEEKALTDKFD